MAGFRMLIQFRMPVFQNGKEKRQYLKSIAMEMDKEYNRHVSGLGDWPLMIQVVEGDQPERCALFVGKVLEPNEDPGSTMDDIIAFARGNLALRIERAERVLFD